MTTFSFENRWAASVARTLVPAGVLGGVTGEVDVGARFAEEVERSPWFAALFIRLAVWMTWFAPLWMLRRPRTFGSLPEAERCATLDALSKSRFYLVRQASSFLKLIACVLLMGDEPTLARVGAYRLGERRTTALRSLP